MDKKYKLLLVDDEVEFLETTAKILRKRHIECETAECCREGLDWLGRDCFDVVLMDVSMPGLDGLQCMAEMRKVQPDLNIIILTGNSSLSYGINGMKQGAFNYCLKPIVVDDLIEMILLARRAFKEIV